MTDTYATFANDCFADRTVLDYRRRERNGIGDSQGLRIERRRGGDV